MSTIICIFVFLVATSVFQGISYVASRTLEDDYDSRNVEEQTRTVRAVRISLILANTFCIFYTLWSLAF